MACKGSAVRSRLPPPIYRFILSQEVQSPQKNQVVPLQYSLIETNVRAEVADNRPIYVVTGIDDDNDREDNAILVDTGFRDTD